MKMKRLSWVLMFVLMLLLVLETPYAKLGESYDKVIIDTSLGKIYVVLYKKETPKNIALFKGLATGDYEWVTIDGKKHKKPYYTNRKVQVVFPNRYTLIGGEGAEYYQWVGYDVDDEIYKKGKVIHGVISDNHYANLVWGNYLLPLYDKNGFQGHPEAKKLYNEVLRKKNFRPLFGKTVQEIKKMTGSSVDIHERLRVRSPQRGDVFMYNIGADTAYGVFGIYNATPHLDIDKRYSIIGRVVRGMNVVDKIRELPRHKHQPKKRVNINSVTFYEHF